MHNNLVLIKLKINQINPEIFIYVIISTISFQQGYDQITGCLYFDILRTKIVTTLHVINN